MERYTVYFYELDQKWYVWDTQINGMVAGTESESREAAKALAYFQNGRNNAEDNKWPFTMGVWEMKLDDRADVYHYYIDTKMHTVASRIDRIEDAKLIAAAPSLLQALKLANMCLKELAPDAYDKTSVYTQIQEAIKKATA